MKSAQVAIYVIFAVQYCHAAYTHLEPFSQLDQLNMDDVAWNNNFDNHHIHTQMIKIFPSSLEEEVEDDSNVFKEVQFFKRGPGGRGTGRAKRRAEAKAKKAEAKAQAGTPNQGTTKPKPQQNPTQHSPEPTKKGMSKTKAGLLVAGGAVAGAGAVHAMSGGGSSGDPNAPPP